MAEIKKIRDSVELAVTETIPEVIAVIDSAREACKNRVAVGVAVTMLFDDGETYEFAHDVGEAVRLCGAVQVLALQLTHDQAFED